MKNIAIIDLGSNSVRMIIMQIMPNGAYKMIEQVKTMVKLSEGMAKNNELQEEPIKRTLYTLSLFNELMKVHKVKEVYPLATAAVRNASNSEYFLERVLKETNLKFRVITGEEEAYYDYLGVINSMEYDDFILVDIGGGSTEIVLVNEKAIVNSISIPYGAITITEKFEFGDLVSKEKIKLAENELEKFIHELDWIEKGKGIPIIGIGGTLRSIAKMHIQAKELPVQLLHGQKIEVSEFENYLEKIIKSDLEERIKIEGVGKERAEVIVGGLIPIKIIMKILEPEVFIMSNKGLREGFFYEYYNGEKKSNKTITEQSVKNTMLNYNCDINHHKNVVDLSSEIFESLKLEYEFSEDDKKILYYAAMLHDIGMYIDYFDHQNHSFYLIMNTDINGLTHEELVKCAFVAGMHRIEKKLAVNWKIYNQYIDKEENKKLKKLALILMIAEKIERRESGVVQKINSELNKTEYLLELESKENLELEIAAILNIEKVFKKNYKRKLIIKQKN